MTSIDSQKKGERLAKVMARAGVCSRRDAEVMMLAGRVMVNGKRIETPATLVTDDDVILVDGKPLPARMPPRVWRMHKPAGLMTTHKDPEGRPTVFDALPHNMPRVISVGRLDLNSEGLLLLTNDGELARQLELPSNGWSRKYRVRVYGRVQESDLQRLERGMTVDGVNYGSVKAVIARQQGSNAWLEVTLNEGKNREIRVLMQAIGLHVNRLIRVNYGPFALGDLPINAVEELAPKILKDMLGARVADKLPSKAEEGRERRRREREGLPPVPKEVVEPQTSGPKRIPKVRQFDVQEPRKGRSGAKPASRPSAKPGARRGKPS